MCGKGDLRKSSVFKGLKRPLKTFEDLRDLRRPSKVSLSGEELLPLKSLAGHELYVVQSRLPARLENSWLWQHWIHKNQTSAVFL